MTFITKYKVFPVPANDFFSMLFEKFQPIPGTRNPDFSVRERRICAQVFDMQQVTEFSKNADGEKVLAGRSGRMPTDDKKTENNYLGFENRSTTGCL